MKKILIFTISCISFCIFSCIKQEMQNPLGGVNITLKDRTIFFSAVSVAADTIIDTISIDNLISYKCSLSNGDSIIIFSGGYATYQSSGIKSNSIVLSGDNTIQIKDGPLWEVHLKKVKFLYPTRDTIIIDGYFKRQ